MVGYVANSTLCEALNEFRESLGDIEINEEVFSFFFQCLKSPNYHPSVCDILVERIEKEIQDLDEQIHSYDFQDPKKFLEILPPSQQAITDLPIEVYIDNVQLEVCIAELEQPIESDVRDPIAAYMDTFFSLIDRLGCIFRDQAQYMHEGLPTIASMAWWKFSQPTSFSGLIEWLIWNFSIT